MKKIKICIQDSEKISENDILGFEKNNTINLTDLYFDETQLSGYWIDPAVDKDGGQDIIFYIGGLSFVTPYNTMSEKILKDCLKLGL
jgi:hypothetical protein